MPVVSVSGASETETQSVLGVGVVVTGQVSAKLRSRSAGKRLCLLPSVATGYPTTANISQHFQLTICGTSLVTYVG